jgi:hypothetical protein
MCKMLMRVMRPHEHFTRTADPLIQKNCLESIYIFPFANKLAIIAISILVQILTGNRRW